MSAPSSDRAAIRQIIRALKAAGHALSYVNDGEENIKVSTETEAIEAIMAVDEATLVVKLPDGKSGWVYFVLGNDPDEVACDYTTNLDPTMDDLTTSWWS